MDSAYIWDRHIAPVRQNAFIVAGPERYLAMSCNRMAISLDVANEDAAARVADKFDKIFSNCPRRQVGYAAIAAMGVR